MRGTPISILLNDMKKNVINTCIETKYKLTPFHYRARRPFDFDSCFLKKNKGSWEGLVISCEYGSVYPKVIKDNGCNDLEGFDSGIKYKTTEDIVVIVNNIGELFLKVVF